MPKSNLGPALLLGAILLFGIMILFPYLFSYALLAVVFLVILGVAGVIVYAIYTFLMNRFSPTVRVRARVVRKLAKDWDVTITGETPEMAMARLGLMGRNPKEAAKAYTLASKSPNVPELTLAEGLDCYITFDVNGRELELSVPQSVYVAAEEGTEGMLVFQGEKFKHFVQRISD